MKIALAQINPTVGDLNGNRDLIVDYSRRAASAGAELVIFPELCVTGYPPLDLLDSAMFIARTEATVKEIARLVPPDIGVLIGAPLPNLEKTGKRVLNTALILEGGSVHSKVGKRLLPTYNVFDEYRYFEPASEQEIVTFRGLRLGIHICEDMWNIEEFVTYHMYDADPLKDLYDQGVDVFVNISASPFSSGIHDLRTKIVAHIAERFQKPFIMVNQVGANTELVFDGDSRVHDASGKLVCSLPSFEEAITIWDTDHPKVAISDNLRVPGDRRLSDIHSALVLGIRDYFNKTGAFSKILVGLSGGIDSALTCALAVDAVGADRVVGVTLPSKYSSSGSVDDSIALAKNLNIECDSISIRPAIAAFDDMLKPMFDSTTPGIAEENIQARTRGVVLMAISNKFNYLLLTTGNKSEHSMGYATLYGDMSGGLAVLADLFKTLVYELSEFINSQAGHDLIPRNSITKPPSAELAPDQKDEDSLPPYPVLDEILRRYIEEREDLDEIGEKTDFDRDLIKSILTTVDRNEYKRRQSAPGLRVTSKAFGMGRRLPIVQGYNR